MSTEPGELGPRRQRPARIGCATVGLIALLLGAGFGAVSSYVLQGPQVREAERRAQQAEGELQRQRNEIEILKARTKAAYWERVAPRIARA